MIDTSVIGRHTARTTVRIERGRLRLFARVLGQDDPVYSDLEAARAAGHPDLPVPPTFLMGLEIETEDVYRTFDSLGVSLYDVLHGEQTFVYHDTAYAGDELVLDTSISDVYQRKGGALQFIVRRTEITRDGRPIAELGGVLVVVDQSAGEAHGG